jgi:hypothetical protein
VQRRGNLKTKVERTKEGNQRHYNGTGKEFVDTVAIGCVEGKT